MRVKHNMQKTLSYCRFGLVKKRENPFVKIHVKAFAAFNTTITRISNKDDLIKHYRILKHKKYNKDKNARYYNK